MAQKKGKHPTGQKAPKGKQQASASKAAKATGTSKTWMIVAAVAAVLVIGYVVINGAGGSKATTTTATPSAAEAKYLGRLLPAGYQEPSIAAPQTYSSTVEMTDLKGTTTETQLSIPLADVANGKVTHVTYEGAKGTLPLIAYVKPSGKLFVGVSSCPPCQGEWQTIQADGTLTCNSCGTKRDLETQAGISGTCKLYPLDELPATVANGTITIDRAAIDSWTPQPIDRPVG